jgi:hypothetical protein
MIVEPPGVAVTIIVQAAHHLDPEGPLQRVIVVPAVGDSDKVRFGFRARTVGLQQVLVSAWAGGTFLAELTLQISVAHNGPYDESGPRAAPVHRIAAEPGEVTLQVNFDGRHHSFQLLSASTLFEPVLAESITATPSDAVERAISTLRSMADGSSAYHPSTARRWMQETGTGLWKEMVPGVIQEQFWQVRRSITAFTIATGQDTIPWEMLYPLSATHDAGFLVEQFPVLRRTYGQRRSSRIGLFDARYIVPPRSPSHAHQEIATIDRILSGDHDGPTVISDLTDMLSLIDSEQMGLAHFACHNAFDSAGSQIRMTGGPFVPQLLNSATTQRRLRHTSPLVFINACRSAGVAPEYTRMMGWANQFMAAGAGAFVGTLWAVRSETSTRFAESFYRSLVAGARLGEAVHQARLAASKGARDPTWLAYTVYGDPTATIAL